MNKALIVPIIALFALVIKHAFGYTLPQEAIDVITDSVLSITTLIGILMHPVKQEANTDAGEDTK